MADTRPLPRIRDSASPDPWANLRTSSDPGENQAQRRSPSAVGGRLALIRCNGNLRSADNCSIPLRLGLLLTLSSAVLPSAPYFRSISSVAGAWVPAFVERSEEVSAGAQVMIRIARVSPELGFRPSLSAQGGPRQKFAEAATDVSPELGFRPSLSVDHGSGGAAAVFGVSPELGFRPSLSELCMTSKIQTAGSVAGAWVPAFVERC